MKIDIASDMQKIQNDQNQEKAFIIKHLKQLLILKENQSNTLPLLLKIIRTAEENYQDKIREIFGLIFQEKLLEKNIDTFIANTLEKALLIEANIELALESFQRLINSVDANFESPTQERKETIIDEAARLQEKLAMVPTLVIGHYLTSEESQKYTDVRTSLQDLITDGNTQSFDNLKTKIDVALSHETQRTSTKKGNGQSFETQTVSGPKNKESHNAPVNLPPASQNKASTQEKTPSILARIMTKVKDGIPKFFSRVANRIGKMFTKSNKPKVSKRTLNEQELRPISQIKFNKDLTKLKSKLDGLSNPNSSSIEAVDLKNIILDIAAYDDLAQRNALAYQLLSHAHEVNATDNAKEAILDYQNQGLPSAVEIDWGKITRGFFSHSGNNESTSSASASSKIDEALGNTQAPTVVSPKV